MDVSEIQDRNSFEAWLQDKPIEWAQVLAARIALRVAPLALSVAALPDDVLEKKHRESLILLTFRANFISLAARKYPTDDMSGAAGVTSGNAYVASIRASLNVDVGRTAVAAVSAAHAAVSAANAAADAAANASATAAANAAPTAAAYAAATVAADAVYAVADAVAVVVADTAAYAAAHVAVDDLENTWSGINKDCAWLEKHSQEKRINAPSNVQALVNQPLWMNLAVPDTLPNWAKAKFHQFNKSDLAQTKSFGLITDWYRSVLQGKPSPFSKEAELAIAKMSQDDWGDNDEERDCVAVMDRVAEIVGWGRKDDGLIGDEEEKPFFSIIRSATANAWGNNKTITQLPRSRLFEYTSPVITERLKLNKQSSVMNLLDAPVLFALENGVAGASKIGKLSNFSLSNSNVHFEYDFDNRVQDLPDEVLLKLEITLGIYGTFAQNRTHWSVHDGDLFELLAECGLVLDGDFDTHNEKELSNPVDEKEEVSLPSAVPNVTSPFDYAWNASGLLTLHSDALACLSIPENRNPVDGANRLEACRAAAQGLARTANEGLYQISQAYASSLQKYAEFLPGEVNQSIYLADMEIRNLRDDLEDDIKHGVDERFARRLKRVIEQHYGLRPYFPDLLNFYDDVREGALSEPPPLDAINELKSLIKENTPDVFDESVNNTIRSLEDDTQHEDFEEYSLGGEKESSSNEGLSLPTDPIADIDPERAKQHATSGALNKVYEVLRGAEKSAKNVEKAEKTAKTFWRVGKPLFKWLIEVVDKSNN